MKILTFFTIFALIFSVLCEKNAKEILDLENGHAIEKVKIPLPGVYRPRTCAQYYGECMKYCNAAVLKVKDATDCKSPSICCVLTRDVEKRDIIGNVHPSRRPKTTSSTISPTPTNSTKY